jgi:hypothetical protein
MCSHAQIGAPKIGETAIADLLRHILSVDLDECKRSNPDSAACGFELRRHLFFGVTSVADPSLICDGGRETKRRNAVRVVVFQHFHSGD